MRIVGAGDHRAERHLVGEIGKACCNRQNSRSSQVLVIDVRDHRRGKQFQKRSIAFIRLGDH
jgi:hypothetical protein